MTKTLEQLESERLAWSIIQFPEATAESSLIKLEHEILEVKMEIFREYENPDYESQSITEEYADCLMCLLDSAGRYGISIEEITRAFEKKLEINKSRIWRKNADNTYSHIK